MFSWFRAKRTRTKSTTRSLVMKFHMPSHASTINSSSSGSSVMCRISGRAEIIWSWGCNNIFCLYIWSPSALERLRPPFTLPSLVTSPPAFTMRCISGTSSGLWSWLSSTALPLLQRTHRESPALATYSSFPLSNATTAVHPLSAPGYAKIIVTLRNVNF